MNGSPVPPIQAVNGQGALVDGLLMSGTAIAVDVLRNRDMAVGAIIIQTVPLPSAHETVKWLREAIDEIERDVIGDRPSGLVIS